MTEFNGVSPRLQAQQYIDARGDKPLLTVNWRPTGFDGVQQQLVGHQAVGPDEGFAGAEGAQRFLRRSGVTGTALQVDDRHVPVTFTQPLKRPEERIRTYSLDRVEAGTWSTKKVYGVGYRTQALPVSSVRVHGSAVVGDIVRGSELLQVTGSQAAHNVRMGVLGLAGLGLLAGAAVFVKHEGEQSPDEKDSAYSPQHPQERSAGGNSGGGSSLDF